MVAGMKNKILVIEDDRAISELLCMNLEAAGYETVAAYDGEEAQRLLLWHEDADMAVVDIMLPGKDGFALMEDFKKKDIPVIYLTAKDDVTSKVKGLKLGAEDYMVKPFEMLELLVRIEKVLERTGRARKVLMIRNIMVDVQSHQVLKDGIPVNLKPMEYDLFVLLLQNKNIALGREELLKRVWGEDYPETREGKIAFALRNGIAVWDVLAGCDIKGADDSSIRNPQPNDLSRILECADVKAIFTTGTKAFQLYKKFCYPKTGIMAIGLPSTSPANCRTSYEQLFEAYSEIKKYI